MYTTGDHPVGNRFFVAVFKSPDSMITRLFIDGNLGANGAGVVTGGELPQVSGSLYRGFYKSVHDGQNRDPAVNHLTLVSNGQGWGQTFTSSTSIDDDNMSGPGVSLLVYIMFGGEPVDGSPTAAAFEALATAVEDGCLKPAGTVCICDGSGPDGCPDSAASYSVQGPTFGQDPSAQVSRHTDDSTLIRPDPTALGLSVICLPGAHLAPNDDKVILIPRSQTCGAANATAAGGAFLSCNHGASVCGSNDANMLACSAMPNGYVTLFPRPVFVPHTVCLAWILRACACDESMMCSAPKRF
jgi:hypothetical protein